MEPGSVIDLITGSVVLAILCDPGCVLRGMTALNERAKHRIECSADAVNPERVRTLMDFGRECKQPHGKGQVSSTHSSIIQRLEDCSHQGKKASLNNPKFL
ncbi:hypothetical protein CDAR_393951 [Caerostris darwini]|uniref:Uncharacterized protein n=1 Tax=Caerostris darwini TaxID=1538125 RepID=A0AAV4T3A2_9ARAC|nr:hypothetical protein CDAR_393951 [Caerostris darwini]